MVSSLASAWPRPLAQTLRNLDPVIDAKPFDVLKFADVITNKCQALTRA